jgi:hypothetical protein
MYLYIKFHLSLFNLKMRLGIVGSRSFTNYKLFKRKILRKYKLSDIEVIVSGGAIGTDSLAERFANEYDIPLLIHRPDWTKGKIAAVIRNQKIVNDSDKIVAFWDEESKGTEMTIKMAKKKKMRPYVIRYLKL